MRTNNKNNQALLSKMLEAFALHKTNSVLSSLDSQEPRLEASVTLSGNGQVPDSFIGKSNGGVDPNKFFSSKNMEPSLQASITLSGNGQVPDSFIGKSNGVDSSKFLTHEDDDLTMPPVKPQSNLGTFASRVAAPLRILKLTNSR